MIITIIIIIGIFVTIIIESQCTGRYEKRATKE